MVMDLIFLSNAQKARLKRNILLPDLIGVTHIQVGMSLPMVCTQKFQ